MIQYELITITTDYLCERVLEPLKKVQYYYYSIMADEVTDPHGNQEKMSLCL